MLAPTAAHADSFFPTTFLNISGTYIYQAFDAHCSSLRPPNNVLFLELESEEAIDEGRRKRLTYFGHIDHYVARV